MTTPLSPGVRGRVVRTLVALALAAVSTVALAAPRTKIAVTEIKNVQGVSAGTATILSDIVVSEVARAGHDVVSQSDIKAMIGFEKQKQVLGCSEDSSCLAEIGGALGVDYMLAGQVGQIGTRYRVSVMLVETKKARVVARAAQFCDQNEDALARAAETTVRELLATAAAASASAAARGAPSLEVRPPPPGPSRAAPAPVGVAAVSDTARPAPKRSRLPAYLTMGGGGVLLAAGALTGLAAKSRYSDLESKKGQLGYYETYEADKSGIRSLAVAADVMMVGGAVATGVGGWLWWRARPAQVAVVPTSGDGAVLVAAGQF